MTATRYRSWGWLAIVAVLCAGILVAMGAGGGAAHQAFANDPTDDAIAVTGVGVATGTPDTITVDFGVQARRATVDDTLNDLSTYVNKVISTLKADGVAEADITTNGLNVYQWHNPKTERSGFIASENVEARISPLDKAGQTISDVATSSSHVSVGGMFFDISNDDALMKQARSNAFADAKDRATQYATLAGRSLGRVEKISETIDNGGVVYGAYASAGAAKAAPVPIEPGQQQVTVNVTVTFQMT